MRIKPGHIELFVHDPRASRRFYEEGLGCEVEAVQGESFVWLKLGQLTILLRPKRTAPAPATYQDASGAIVLYTEDLSEARAALEERGIHIAGTDGSEECLTFRDPDGNWFQLVDPNDH